MNYAYMIYSGSMNNMLSSCLKSLDKHVECEILFHHIGMKIEDIKKLKLKNKVRFIDVRVSDWKNKRMFCKIEALKRFNFKNGDNVFVLDADLIIQDDIFKAFEQTFDIALTSRHYKYWYRINAGVWAFRYNDRVKRFLEFYVDEILDSKWLPFVTFQNRFKHKGKLDWYCDQDFLCVVFDNELPFKCKIVDLGYKYNYCPSVEEKIPGSFKKASEEILKQVKNKEYKVLHFKGSLKELLK